MGGEPDLEALAREIEEEVDNIAVPETLLRDSDSSDKRNLAVLIADMKAAERLKLAMKGGREARVILMRDSSLLVKRMVLQNPRISDEEVVMVAKNRHMDKEILEAIPKRKEWVQNYQIRYALVTNPKTPLAIAMRYVSSLMKRDLRQLAKSKNIPAAINSMAKRIVLQSK